MKQKPRSRVNRKKAKTVLRLPDLEHAKAAVLNSLTSATPSAGIVMPSTSSLTGIALSPVWHSIASWSYGTGAIWNPGNSLQELSTSAWALCGGSRTKLPIAVCSVRISRLAFAASKV